MAFVAHRFLKLGGKLGFVITQSVFKTAGAGQGFRRFRIGQAQVDQAAAQLWGITRQELAEVQRNLAELNE